MSSSSSADSREESSRKKLKVQPVKEPPKKRVESNDSLLANQTFMKFLKTEHTRQHSFDDIVKILQKPSDSRTKEDVIKLKQYFAGLQFFESIKRENHNDEEIIYQSCKELKYRKYEAGQAICKYGEEGFEFYVTMRGIVSVFVPQHVEVALSYHELQDFIVKNKDMIIWERHNRHMLEMYNNLISGSPTNQQKQMDSLQMKKVRSSVVIDLNKTIYSFKILKKVMELNEGNGFGELALIQHNKKLQKRAATIICNEEVHVALLGKEDFEKVMKNVMQKRIDDKVEFLQHFRLTMGLSRDLLVNMTYLLKERWYRRRDCLYKEGDEANGMFFVKDGEFEISTKHRTYMDSTSPKLAQKLLKTKDIKISIIGANSCIGLEDLQKDISTIRTQKVTCVSEKACVYYLSKDDYYKMVFKNLKKNVVEEASQLKKPFFTNRVQSLKVLANKDNLQWLHKKERFLSKEQMSQEQAKDAKSTLEKIQNEELCKLLQQHRLLKKPQLKIDRVNSQDEEIDDFDPGRHSKKEYFMKLAELYHELMYNYDSIEKSFVVPPSPAQTPQRLSLKNVTIIETQVKTNTTQQGLTRIFDSVTEEAQEHEMSAIFNTQKNLLSPDYTRNALGHLKDSQSFMVKQQQQSIDQSKATKKKNSMQLGGFQPPMTTQHQASKISSSNTSQIDFFLEHRMSHLRQPSTGLDNKRSTLDLRPQHTQDFPSLNEQTTDTIQMKIFENSYHRRNLNWGSKSIKNLHNQTKSTLTIEDIRAHLQKSQESLFIQLQERLNAKKSKGASPTQGLTRFDLHSQSASVLPSLLKSIPTSDSPNRKFGSPKASNIYFNMFINRKK